MDTWLHLIILPVFLNYFDFSGLHERFCNLPNMPGTPNSDYELWTPTTADGNCLLGRKTQYARRKQDRECFNGIEHEPVTVVENCPCTREDYLCDYCFETKPADQDAGNFQPCVLDDDCKANGYNVIYETAPSTCKVGEMFNLTQGYRLASGDSCSLELKGAMNLLPTPYPCPDLSQLPPSSNDIVRADDSGGSSAWIVVLILMLVIGFIAILGLIGVYLYRKWLVYGSFTRVNTFEMGAVNDGHTSVVEEGNTEEDGGSSTSSSAVEGSEVKTQSSV